MRIAAVLLTLDEEVHIERAILSLLSLDGEIDVYVIDSFSSDRTVELARAAGATVLQRVFDTHAAQLEWGLSQIAGRPDWLLRLDADEVLSAPLVRELSTAMSKASKNVSAFALRRQHVFWNRPIRFGGRYPTVLVRVWRPGHAYVEQRWMDEHVVVTSGRVKVLDARFYDWNLNDLAFFTKKHNDYATREAVGILLGDKRADSHLHRQAARRRFFKTSLFYRLPFPVAAAGYFIFRYIFQLGFLDGLEGLVYHGLQGGWYRFLVGARLRELKSVVGGASSREEVARLLREATGLAIGPIPRT